MAYWVQKTSSNHNMINCKSFICDYLVDIKKLPKFGIPGEEQEGDNISSLPVSYGSYCLCLEDSSRWILGKATNEWKKVNIDAGSSSGEIDLDIATEEEVNSVLDDVFTA